VERKRRSHLENLSSVIYSVRGYKLKIFSKVVPNMENLSLMLLVQVVDFLIVSGSILLPLYFFQTMLGLPFVV